MAGVRMAGHGKPSSIMTEEVAFILEELKREVRKANSPWLSRQSAADYCGGCNPVTIDRAANAGHIKRYFRGGDGLPVFKRKELDAWMEMKSGN